MEKESRSLHTPSWYSARIPHNQKNHVRIGCVFCGWPVTNSELEILIRGAFGPWDRKRDSFLARRNRNNVRPSPRMVSAFEHPNKVPIGTNRDEIGWDYWNASSGMKEALGNDKNGVAHAMTIRIFDGGVHHVGMGLVSRGFKFIDGCES